MAEMAVRQPHCSAIVEVEVAGTMGRAGLPEHIAPVQGLGRSLGATGSGSPIASWSRSRCATASRGSVAETTPWPQPALAVEGENPSASHARHAAAPSRAHPRVCPGLIRPGASHLGEWDREEERLQTFTTLIGEGAARKRRARSSHRKDRFGGAGCSTDASRGERDAAWEAILV